MGNNARYLLEGFSSEEFFNFPNIINLEVFRGKCPCSCVHCPVGCVNVDKRTSRFGLKGVSEEILEKVVSEMKLFPHSTLRLHSVGDPILWDGLISALKYIKQSGVKSWLFTSLVTRDKNVVEKLAEYCDIVEVSVNSIDEDDYRQTKGINAYKQVVENIRYMSSYIHSNNLNTRLVVSRVQTDSDKNDSEFVKYWKDFGLVADAFVRKYHTYNDILENELRPVKKKTPCLVHWMRFNISCEGVVVSCFNELFRSDLRSDVILGDIRVSTIQQIWHSDYLSQIREAELKGYDNSSFDNDFPCRNCRSCQAYGNGNVTSECQINALNNK